MKLAEALILRADYQKRIAQLQQRLIRSARVQEGEQPPEDPQELVTELETTTTELTRLIHGEKLESFSFTFTSSLVLSANATEIETPLVQPILLPPAVLLETIDSLHPDDQAEIGDVLERL